MDTVYNIKIATINKNHNLNLNMIPKMKIHRIGGLNHLIGWRVLNTSFG